VCLAAQVITCSLGVQLLSFDTQSLSEVLKLAPWQRLGKEVSRVVSPRDVCDVHLR
jgi:hypothetical protein